VLVDTAGVCNSPMSPRRRIYCTHAGSPCCLDRGGLDSATIKELDHFVKIRSGFYGSRVKEDLRGMLNCTGASQNNYCEVYSALAMTIIKGKP
jgi:hypothetical protein